MTIKNRFLFLFGLVLSLALGSCGENTSTPSVDHIQPEFDFVRFDQALMNLDTQNFSASLDVLQTQYPAFSKIYFEQILRIPEEGSKQILDYIHDKTTQALNDSIQSRYKDMSGIRNEFTRAFQYYEYYFPSHSAPNLYTTTTEFSVGAFLFTDTLAADSLRDAIGISLEFFLGQGFPYHKLGSAGQSTFSSYLTRTFNRDHLVRKAMQVLVEDHFSSPRDNRLIDYMIQNGAQLVIIEHLLPQIADSVLFEWAPAQVNWCQENELQIWAHLIDKDLLYSRRMADIATLIRPAPSSAGMPASSPGQTANYIGYRIIKSYLKQTGADIQDLVKLKDAQEVLSRSKYKAG